MVVGANGWGKVIGGVRGFCLTGMVLFSGMLKC